MYIGKLSAIEVSVKKKVNQVGDQIEFFFNKSDALSYLNDFFSTQSRPPNKGECKISARGVSKFLKLRNRGYL